MEKVSPDLDEASYYTCKSHYDLENVEASLQGAAESKEQLAALDNASGVGTVFREIADEPSNTCNDDYLQEKTATDLYAHKHLSEKSDETNTLVTTPPQLVDKDSSYEIVFSHQPGKSTAAYHVDNKPVSGSQNTNERGHRERHDTGAGATRHHISQDSRTSLMAKRSMVYKDTGRPLDMSVTNAYLTQMPSQSSGLSLPVSKSGSSHDISTRRHGVSGQMSQSLNTSVFSEGPVCRICHEGDSSEVLISPCYCAGSMGLLHVSCLQTWLGSSNKTNCEICHFQFALQRKPKPLSEFFRDPGSRQERQSLWFDLAAFCLITPMSAFVTWICMFGAVKYYHDAPTERSGLLSLAVTLIALYFIWITVAVHQNWQMWQRWKRYHQDVTLLCQPQPEHKSTENLTASALARAHRSHGNARIQLQSIQFNISNPKPLKTSRSTRRKLSQHSGHPRSGSERSLTRHQGQEVRLAESSAVGHFPINNKLVKEKETNRELGPKYSHIAYKPLSFEAGTFINNASHGHSDYYGNRYYNNKYYDFECKNEVNENPVKANNELDMKMQKNDATGCHSGLATCSHGNSYNGVDNYTASWVDNHGQAQAKEAAYTSTAINNSRNCKLDSYTNH